MWAARALHEVRRAQRTWFCTYTLSPQSHYVMQCRAVAHAEARAIPPAELHGDELLDRQSREVEEEFTKMMKRLRKELGSLSMRYLLVREKHETGLPHWHALIHQTGDSVIKYRQLREQWEWGFVKIKLVDDGIMAARYVTKYLSKSRESRIRASLRYGRIADETLQTPSGIALPEMGKRV